MKNLIYLLIVSGLMFTFQACSSENDPAPLDTDNSETSLVLKVINVLDSDGNEFQIKFNCQENKLIRIEFPEKRCDFFYDGELLSRQEEYRGDSSSITEYEYDSNSRLMRSYWTNSNNWYVDETIEYSGNKATVRRITGSPDGTTSERVINVWFGNGNVVALKSYDDEGNYEFEFSYDNNPNIFSNIKGLEKISVVQLSFQFYIIGVNNAQSMIGLNNTNYRRNYTYQYNSMGYPTNATVRVTTEDGSEYVESYTLEYY
ncbi:hypothetical protein J1N09_01535 [Aureitalea sp. L0-47]|uniref:hypothetical protein n=1 Tax=Aureitalea sp. L0-47 TaxID=2816962 RepID=UPI002237C679|nr:hypothetical protein [Aureitalea sp. L0-47]MCW5518502.1 hypothetical protein [Aureitalea sp. L0-47]